MSYFKISTRYCKIKGVIKNSKWPREKENRAKNSNITKAAQRKVKERNIAEEQKDEIGVISSKVGGAIQIW